MEPPTCPDCEQVMQIGFIPDSTDGAFLQTRWHLGEMKSRGGIFKLIPAALRCNVKSMIPITTYRCTKCGLLKSFALSGDE